MVQPYLQLNDSSSIPQLGLGVWRLPDGDAPNIVSAALADGYRSIDTAAIYGNEAGVGEGIARADVDRRDLFLTTKVWNEDQGFDATLRAFDASLQKLRQDYVDLYLIHWPVAGRDLFVDTWRAMIRLREEGRARSIGVCNFQIPHLQRLIDESGVTPAVNQIELHPDFPQRALRAFHEENGILTESWSPLGQGRLIQNPLVVEIASKYGKTPAQAILRWHLDLGLVVIPKTATRSRLPENLDVFDFTLDAEDIARLSALEDPAGRIGPDPDAFSI
jgi:2,5-diketo-D-gluconate reductase A